MSRRASPIFQPAQNIKQSDGSTHDALFLVVGGCIADLGGTTAHVRLRAASAKECASGRAHTSRLVEAIVTDFSRDDCAGTLLLAATRSVLYSAQTGSAELAWQRERVHDSEVPVLAQAQAQERTCAPINRRQQVMCVFTVSQWSCVRCRAGVRDPRRTFCGACARMSAVILRIHTRFCRTNPSTKLSELLNMCELQVSRSNRATHTGWSAQRLMATTRLPPPRFALEVLLSRLVTAPQANEEAFHQL